MRYSGGRFSGGIIIHHSLTADGTTANNTKAIAKYHKETNGWDDIGYHYLVESIRGKIQIMTGRPIQFKGAHCPPNNSIGICLIGNFDKSKPSMERLMWLNRLVIGLMIIYNMSPDDVHYHSDYSKKTCPGGKFPKEEFLHTLKKEYNKL
jgi:hypothetical protein